MKLQLLLKLKFLPLDLAKQITWILLQVVELRIAQILVPTIAPDLVQCIEHCATFKSSININ